MTQLNCSKIYNVGYNPFPWMEMISMQGKTNFFEKRAAEYQKAGVMDSASLGSVQQRFSVDEDFLNRTRSKKDITHSNEHRWRNESWPCKL